MRNQARIFGQSGKPVNKYQERINEVAGDICVHDPALLVDRGRLLELAKDRVHESGYAYVKGKSRSKKFTLTEHEENRPKHEKIEQQERHHRVESLSEELKDTNKHIAVKEK